MATKTNGKTNGVSAAIEPLMHQRGPIVQDYGALRNLPTGLDEDARKQSVQNLNQVLADTIQLASMYKKHHWQVSGHTFYQLHLLFDKHYEEQTELVDTLAERISLLGGVTNGMPAAVARITKIETPPDGVEEPPVQISRLLEGHELIMKECRDFAGQADDAGDDGTNDLFVSQVLRVNELQTWFVVSHVVPEPLVHADAA